jgi:hypothetical protein
VVSWITLLCRPEGALFSAAVYALLLAAARVQGRDVRLVRLTVNSGVLFVALTGLYAAWKYAYFGYLLPNPYYVKSNRISLAGFSHVRDFIEFAVWRLGPLAALVVVMIAAAVRRSAIPARAGAILAMLLVPAMLGLGFYLTIIHEVGGAHRFSYPLLVYLTLALAFSASFASNGPWASTHYAAAFRPELVLGPASIAWLLALQPAYDFRPLPRGGFNDYHFRIAEALRDTGLGPSATVLTDAAGVIPYVSGFSQLDRVGLTDNHLSGRVPLGAVERETYIWSRAADVYIGYEPPARAGAESPAADPLMRTPYVFDILLRRRLQTIEDRIFVQDEALLHTRMRELRDNWYWIGEIDWPGLRLWKLKSFLYVRKTADQRLRTHLAVLVNRTPEQIVFTDVSETGGVVRATP